jgi:hypothetical protein
MCYPRPHHDLVFPKYHYYISNAREFQLVSKLLFSLLGITQPPLYFSQNLSYYVREKSTRFSRGAPHNPRFSDSKRFQGILQSQIQQFTPCLEAYSIYRISCKFWDLNLEAFHCDISWLPRISNGFVRFCMTQSLRIQLFLSWRSYPFFQMWLDALNLECVENPEFMILIEVKCQKEI